MGNKNKFLRLIVLGTVGIVLIFVSLYVFYDEYWFGFPSKVIDLNGFIASDSNDKTELPEGYAKLDVNKCYGQFYMSRGGRKIPNTYYYIIDNDNQKYKVSIKINSSLLPFINVGDKIEVSYNKISDVIYNHLSA